MIVFIFATSTAFKNKVHKYYTGNKNKLNFFMELLLIIVIKRKILCN